FLIQTVESPSPGFSPVAAVVLTGSDVRGTIYAIYQFSQQFLGVDPLYWWTDHAPAHRSRVELLNVNISSTPRFRYGGWFINDEDLFTGWTPGIRDGTGISLATWDRMFEALLRLKGNMIVPGTWIFPYEPQIQAAVDRGLVITQHHMNVLGLDTYRWPKDRPYSFTAAPQLLEAGWKRAMSEYPKDAELITSVGYRGQNDYPFWLVDKNVGPTDEDRAKVIRAAIDKEMEIANEVKPNTPIVLNAWREAAKFIHEGFLKVPDGVTLVWPDNGHGLIEDEGQIGAGQGVYYHTAMFDNFSNHFTEMLPVERIQRELGRAAKSGATQFLLVNTSNLRPVVMTTRAVMELAWNPEPWRQSGAADAYLRKWSEDEFGNRAADPMVGYYKAYEEAPARYGEKEDAVMQDNFYQTAARKILFELIAGDAQSAVKLGSQITHDYKNVNELSAAMVRGCQEAEGRWQHVEELAAEARKVMLENRLEFFQANVTTQIQVHVHSNRMLEAVAGAALSGSAEERRKKIAAAIGEGEAVEGALEAADYGKWQGYYTNGDWLLDVPRTIALARAYDDKLAGKEAPENAIIRARDGGFAYWMITAYQGTQQVEF
ncbi:MAG: glycosyl hydrolase 115 family protein, partial [Bryobacteraceae bacterium]